MIKIRGCETQFMSQIKSKDVFRITGSESDINHKMSDLELKVMFSYNDPQSVKRHQITSINTSFQSEKPQMTNDRSTPSNDISP